MSTLEREAPQARRLAGEAGLWVFIMADLTVFALFFGTVLYYRRQDPEAFAAGQHALHPDLAAINTLILIVGSLIVVRAVQATRRHEIELARRLFLAASASAVVFIVVKVLEYSLLIAAGHTIHSDAFFLCYFAFTAVHLLHVAVAFGVFAAIRRGLSHGMATNHVESGGCYWHMVDLIWLILFPLLYLLGA